MRESMALPFFLPQYTQANPRRLYAQACSLRLARQTTQLLDVMDRFIELSGDRAGGIGDSLISGRAWVRDQKIVFVGDNAENGQYGCESWRRFFRMVSFAEHLGRPLVLCDVPLVSDGNEALTELASISHGRRRSAEKLLNSRCAILGIFDEGVCGTLERDLGAFLDAGLMVAATKTGHDSVLQGALWRESAGQVSDSDTVTAMCDLLDIIQDKTVAVLRAERLTRLRAALRDVGGLGEPRS